MTEHDWAVQKLLNSHFQKYNVDNAYADNLSGYDDPPEPPDETPDIFLEFSNGKEKIIEVDTRPMDDHDKKQHEYFQRSAAAKPDVRSYEHYFASEVL